MVGTYTEGDEPVPSFRLEKLLGWGRFGEVWKTSGPGGIHVALKLIPLSNRQGLREFRAMRLVKGIRHPNLVPILAFWLKDRHGSFIDDVLAEDSLSLQDTASEMIIAMGLGECSLHDRFKQCLQQGLAGIPRDELFGYLEDAARAIDYLNQDIHTLGPTKVGIQHCDIKPHNLLLVGGMVQICDLGVARVLEDIRGTAATGSAAYIAPEFLKNNNPSRTTDQYSLAISYIELRTGSLPFNVKSAAAAYLAHLQGKLDLSQLPESEQTILARATALDPEQRFPSCMAMLKALREASSGLRPRPSTQRHPKHITGEPEQPVAMLAQAPQAVAPIVHQPVAKSGSPRQPQFPAMREPLQRIVSQPALPRPVGLPPASRTRPTITKPAQAMPHQPWSEYGTVLKHHASLAFGMAQLYVQRWAQVDENRRRALRILQVFFIVTGGLLLLTPAAFYRASGQAEKPITVEQASAKTPERDDGRAKLSDESAALYEKATALMNAGVYDPAIDVLTQIAKLEPDFGPAYLDRAAAYAQTGAFEAALRDLNRAKELRMDDARWYHLRAKVLIEQSKYQEALLASNEAIKRDPRSPDAYLARWAALNGTQQNAVALLDYAKARQLQPKGRPLDRTTGLVYSAHGSWCAACTDSNQLDGLRVWKGKPGEGEFTLPGRCALAFSLDERLLATGGRLGRILVYDLQTRKCVSELSGHMKAVTCLAFDASGHLLSGGKDDSVRVWDLADGRELATYRGHASLITCVTPIRGGYILSASEEGAIQLWQVDQSDPKVAFIGHSGAVKALQLAPDGRHFASAGVDRTVRLWDLASGHEVQCLRGLSCEASGLSFRPDGQLLAASCGDESRSIIRGQVKVWDAGTGQLVATYGGEPSGFFSVTFSPDGHFLVAGGLAWRLRTWEVTELKPSTDKVSAQTKLANRK